MIPRTDLDGQIKAIDGAATRVTASAASDSGNVSTGDNSRLGADALFVTVPYSLDVTIGGIVNAKVEYKETTDEGGAGSYTELISDSAIFTSVTGGTTTSGVLQEGLNLAGKGQTIDIKATFTLTGGATSDTMDFGVVTILGGYDENPPA